MNKCLQGPNSQRCLNGGKPIGSGDNCGCFCPDGYMGTLCQIKAPECKEKDF